MFISYRCFRIILKISLHLNEKFLLDDALPTDSAKIYQDQCEEQFYLKEIVPQKYLFSMKEWRTYLLSTTRLLDAANELTEQLFVYVFECLTKIYFQIQPLRRLKLHKPANNYAEVNMFCCNYRSQIVPKNSTKDVCQEQTDEISKISDQQSKKSSQ